MNNERKNYYEVLEIETNATPNQIENAYTRVRNAYSGESVALYSLMTKDECDAILTEVEEAYSIIGFPEKRREYDRLRGFNQKVDYNQATSDSINVTNSAKTMNKGQVQYEEFASNIMEAKVSKLAAQKKFGLEYESKSTMDQKISDCAEFTGPFLKEIRDYKNVTIERMAEMTRISKTHINAIENEDIPKLPADVYVRGYVYQIAKVLKLNPEQVAASFMVYFKKLKSQ